MKKQLNALIVLLFFQTISNAWALQLSVSQSRYVPNEELILTLVEDWAGEADVYVAISLPPTNELYFLTPPQHFTLELSPYAEDALASGSREVLRLVLPPGLPVGEYTAFAAAIDPLGFFEPLGKAQASFIYALEAEPVDLVLREIRFPDGVIGRRYSLALEPESGTPPYQFNLASGTLPAGLALDPNTGLIQGEPSARGLSNFTVQVVDGKGNMGEIAGAIRVYGILTFGPQGTYQGCNGLQMAFNASQNLDEIRIQQGTYECYGFEIPKNKRWANGIKISGGWDGSFENQSDDPALTVLDGKGYGRILTVSAGSVSIETLSFQNGDSGNHHGGAIYNDDDDYTNITNCIFTNNRAGDGGAIYRVNAITNSSFDNNSASYNGGAVYDANTITNSTFSNNSASYDGGAVKNAYIINSTFNNNSASNGGAIYGASARNSTFSNNSASDKGGAINNANSIFSCVFSDNSASNGGAVYYANTITNSTFSSNSASEHGGAVYNYNDTTITNSTFTNNKAATGTGGAIYGRRDSIIVNCTIVNNRPGGFYGSGTILNTIFALNKYRGEDASDIDIISSGELFVNFTLVNHIYGAVDYRTYNIEGDPQFVDAENGNFQLLPNSPAIDVGSSYVTTACARYDNCNSSCRNQCDNYNSYECKESCCSCVEYTYPFSRDGNGNVLNDLAGNQRIVGEAIDLGAFEFQ